MARHSLLATISVGSVIAMLLAVPFSTRIVSAGTVWHEGPVEFSNGTMDNVSLVSQALVLGIDEAPLESWKKMNPSTVPTSRAYHSLAYDSANGVAVLFGGWPGNYTLGDTWIYNSTTKEWTNVTTSYAPPARGFHCMVYDADHGEMVLFGGWSGTGFLNDTWTYNVSQNEWTDKSPPEAPAARWCSALTYDSQNGVSVLFGGIDYNYYCDTWTYDLGSNRWTDMNPPDPPLAREAHAMAYDSAHRKVVLFGGYNTYFLKDSWNYDTSTNCWTNVTSSGGPSPRDGITMAYDEVRGEMMFFGGFNGWGMQNDTWAYNSKIFRPSGNFTCGPHDTNGTAYFGALSWDANVPPFTTLAFQFRSADTLENLTGKAFSGPDGTVNTYYEGSGQRIGAANNGTRWFQYRAAFATADAASTPALRRVEVRYNLLHSLKVLSPAGGENWTDVQTISWNATDADGDALRFDLCLIKSTGERTTLASGLTAQEWQWDTSGVVNGTYHIQVVARDGNTSIPLTVNATSGEFIIRSAIEPAQNAPPHVTLLSPANGSRPSDGTIRLQWLGADPEGDPLTYTVLYLDRPFGMGQPHQNVTTAGHLDLFGLADLTTYFWTVDAGDGTNAHTDVPAPVWSFTVTLPPINHPPILAKIPPFIINVSEAFTYDPTATDEDLDRLTFSLVQGPGGISIDQITGRLRWTPASFDIGNHTITVQVADGRGGTDNQTFTITVLEIPIPPKIPPVVPPTCAITYPANGTKVNGTIQLKGTATNGSRRLSVVRIRIDGGAWTSAVGLEDWTFTIDTAALSKGDHRIEARAFAANLSSETASVDVTVSNPEPRLSSGDNPWCMPAIVVAIMAGLVILLILRKKIVGPR